MVFTLYKAGSLGDGKEREQMDQLIRSLNETFQNRPENCRLIIEPKIPYQIDNIKFYKTPDAIVIKDSVICVIDIKNYYGEIIADCQLGELWKNAKGDIIQPWNSKSNPFTQATEYHELIINFLSENIFSNEKKWSKQNVFSWIVTGEASTIKINGINQRENGFFKVIPLDDFSRTLSIQGTDYKATSENIEKIIKIFEAQKVPIYEWFRVDATEIDIPSKPLVNKITFWMNSDISNNHLKALKYIQELELIQHKRQVLSCFNSSPYEKIRQESLMTLINWQDISLGAVFTDALSDSSDSIVNFSLEYLSKYGYPECFDKLHEMLNYISDHHISKVIKAITKSGHKQSGKILFEYAKKNYFKKPFEPYQNIREDYYDTIQERTKEKREKYFELREEESHIFNRVILIVKSLGETRSTDCVPWLIKIITQPTSLGFWTDDFNELDQKTDYCDIFNSACDALDKIGHTQEDLSGFLLDKLNTSPEYFQYGIIKLIGTYKVVNATSLLKPFLDHSSPNIRVITLRSLENIGSDLAFDILSEAYITKPNSYNGVQTGEALRRLNEDKFVDLIMSQVESENVKTGFKEIFLQALLSSVSEKCADTLFDLLKAKKLTSKAAWNLTFLIDNDKIFDRAMDLTYSKNPIEQYGAMWALDKHFIGNPKELVRFEKNRPRKRIRETVAYFYAQSDSKQKLFKYANDPSKDVRDEVFRYFTDKEYLGEFIFASDLRDSSENRVAVDEEYIGIELKNEILVVPKKKILKIETDTYEDQYHGLYFEVEIEDSANENMLLIPARHHFFSGSTRVSSLKTKILGDTKSTSYGNPELLNKLWLKVSKLLPKRPQNYWE